MVTVDYFENPSICGCWIAVSISRHVNIFGYSFGFIHNCFRIAMGGLVFWYDNTKTLYLDLGSN